MSFAKAIVRFGLWGLIVLFACPATDALAADDVWALLKKPGHVVLCAIPTRRAATESKT